MTFTLLDICSGTTLLNRLIYSSPLKEAQEFMEYQRVESIVERDVDNNRVFPLDSTLINNFCNEEQTKIETAIAHVGPYADELSRSFNALAIVLGKDIYFRNGAYKPESEDGRKIIAHELKHIEQYEDKRITQNADLKNLEEEAETAEKRAEYDPDPYEPYPVGKKVFYIRRSRIKKVTTMAADMVEKWLVEEKTMRGEEEYFKLLCAYSDFLNEAV